VLPNGTLSVVGGVNIEVVGCVSLAGKLEVTLSREVEDGETLDILTSRSGCINGSFDNIVVNNDGCAVVTAKEQVRVGNRLFIVLQVDDTSCGSSGLSFGAIGGIIAGGLTIISVVFVAVLVQVKKRHYTV